MSENNIPDRNIILSKDLNVIGLHDYSTKKRLFCSKKALGLPRTFSRHIRHAETLNSHSKTAKTPKCIRKSRIFFIFQQENRARKVGKNPMKNWFLIGSCHFSFKLNLVSLCRAYGCTKYQSKVVVICADWKIMIAAENLSNWIAIIQFNCLV